MYVCMYVCDTVLLYACLHHAHISAVLVAAVYPEKVTTVYPEKVTAVYPEKVTAVYPEKVTAVYPEKGQKGVFLQAHYFQTRITLMLFL
jgi:hypothetical protein